MKGSAPQVELHPNHTVLRRESSVEFLKGIMQPTNFHLFGVLGLLALTSWWNTPAVAQKNIQSEMKDLSGAVHSVTVSDSRVFLAGRNRNQFWLISADLAGQVKFSSTVSVNDSNGDCLVAAAGDGGALGISGRFLRGKRFSTSGEALWAGKFGQRVDWANAITRSPDGGYIVVGTASGEKHNQRNLLAVKLTGSGQLVWRKTIGGNKDDIGSAVATGPNGSIYIAGSTQSNARDKVSKFVRPDAWVLKLDSDGSLLWERVFGGKPTDELKSLAVDSAGDWYATGYTYSLGDNSENLFILKGDSDGDLYFRKSIGESCRDLGNAIALDVGGNVYLGGYSMPCDNEADPAATMMPWVLKLNAVGELDWSIRLEGPGEIESIAVVPTGVFAAGSMGSKPLFSFFAPDGRRLW